MYHGHFLFQFSLSSYSYCMCPIRTRSLSRRLGLPIKPEVLFCSLCFALCGCCVMGTWTCNELYMVRKPTLYIRSGRTLWRRAPLLGVKSCRVDRPRTLGSGAGTWRATHACFTPTLDTDTLHIGTQLCACCTAAMKTETCVRVWLLLGVAKVDHSLSLLRDVLRRKVQQMAWVIAQPIPDEMSSCTQGLKWKEPCSPLHPPI